MKRWKSLSKNKAVVLTTFLAILVLGVLISQFFVIKVRSPPFGISIVNNFVYPDGTPIGSGLNVTLLNDGTVANGTTNSNGTVTFSNLEAGTYSIEYSWQGVDSGALPLSHINGTQIVWTFDKTLPYWTVKKTVKYSNGRPAVGLTVQLENATTILATSTTNSVGIAVFNDVKAGDYNISYIWQGTPKNESMIITFATPSPYYVPNINLLWTLDATFLYNMTTSYPPVGAGDLMVTLVTPSGTSVANRTETGGIVEFDNLTNGTYTLEWMWGGVQHSESIVIGYSTASPVSETYYVEPLNGGEQTVNWSGEDPLLFSLQIMFILFFFTSPITSSVYLKSKVLWICNKCGTTKTAIKNQKAQNAAPK